MLLLPTLTALLLTLYPGCFLFSLGPCPPSQDHFTAHPPGWNRGVPPVLPISHPERPTPLPADFPPPAREAPFPPYHPVTTSSLTSNHPPPPNSISRLRPGSNFGTSVPAGSATTPPLPPPGPSASAPASCEYSFRPAAPFSRSSFSSMGLSSANDSFSMTSGNAEFWQINHPWLGYIFISSPGSANSHPPSRGWGELMYLPRIPFPVTLSEPSSYITEDRYPATPYPVGGVAWITLSSMTSVLPCHHTH